MKKIGILGGDLRMVKLAQLFAKDEYEVYVYGFEKIKISNCIHCTSLQQFSNGVQIIISGIPFSKDNINIFAPYSIKNILIEDTFKCLQGKKIYAGGINEKDINLAKVFDNEITDLLKIEELTLLNIIPTVEGAIQIAMEETEFTIHSSKILVLGFGRIGKLLSKYLSSMGAKVYCEARKEEDLSWIKVLGHNAINIKNLDDNLQQYDIIFNTIPSLILDENRLKAINQKCLIIDLASKPGGVDFKKAEELNIKTNWALALPGKVAPLSAAKYIKNVVEGLI